MWVPAVLVVMNVVYSLAAYPAGALSDRVGRNRILLVGMLLLIVGDLVLAWAPTVAFAAAGVVLWGLHMAFTQGVFATMIADHAPVESRGTAFGIFNLLSGVAMLAASVIAGLLWDQIGPATTFLAGAGFAALASIGFLLLWSRTES